jgi:hypothetical protein
MQFVHRTEGYVCGQDFAMICNFGGDGEWNGLTISWIVPRSISGNAVLRPPTCVVL